MQTALILLVQQNLPYIHTLCSRYRIGRLWVFGSATTPHRFTPESDIDFLYTFAVGEGYHPDFPYAAN